MSTVKMYLTKEERGIIIRRLSKAQKLALFSSLRYTYKSQFGTLLGKLKGSEQWEFVNYIDHGKVRDNIRCQCGQPLRYQFILRNQNTKEKISLGIVHLEEEFKMPPTIAKAVYREIQKVDYDLDEILYKVKNLWKLPSYIVRNLGKIEIPKDVKLLLDADLPILQRHLDHLTELGRDLNRQQMVTDRNAKIAPIAIMLTKVREVLPGMSDELEDGIQELILDDYDCEILDGTVRLKKLTEENRFESVYALVELESDLSSVTKVKIHKKRLIERHNYVPDDIAEKLMSELKENPDIDSDAVLLKSMIVTNPDAIALLGRIQSRIKSEES